MRRVCDDVGGGKSIFHRLDEILYVTYVVRYIEREEKDI